MLSVLEYYRKNQKEGVSDIILPLRIIKQHSEVKSLNLLEQVARDLRIKGLTRSIKGPRGGCQLVADLSKVTIGDIEDGGPALIDVDDEANITNSVTARYNECLNMFFDTLLYDIKGFGKPLPLGISTGLASSDKV